MRGDRRGGAARGPSAWGGGGAGAGSAGGADNTATGSPATGAQGRASCLEGAVRETVPSRPVAARRREGRPGRARGRGGEGPLSPLPPPHSSDVGTLGPRLSVGPAPPLHRSTDHVLAPSGPPFLFSALSGLPGVIGSCFRSPQPNPQLFFSFQTRGPTRPGPNILVPLIPFLT